MRHRNLIIALVVPVVLAAGLFGYSLTHGGEEPASKVETAKIKERMRDACASPGTYDRLKEVAFEEAVRIRNADPANLDQLATHSVVRMEDPVVKNRDDALNVTVCAGRFVLELPPGAERAFGGERRLIADIEYSAQEAVDGSGLVYEISGAEPIIYKLAAFDLRDAPVRLPETAGGDELADIEVPEGALASGPVPPEPTEEYEEVAPLPPAPAPRAEPRREPPRSASARPSFNCAYARSRSERMVCSSDRLAARDRAMSSLFYSALSDADPRTRSTLRRTRDNFLRFRDRCGSEACVAQAYEDRMAEIRDIMADAE